MINGIGTHKIHKNVNHPKQQYKINTIDRNNIKYDKSSSFSLQFEPITIIQKISNVTHKTDKRMIRYLGNLD